MNKLRGSFYVNCGACFVQFSRAIGSYRMIMDLGVYTEDEQVFSKDVELLGYKITNEAYRKEVLATSSDDGIKKLIDEVSQVFYSIYKLPADTPYSFQESFNEEVAIPAAKANVRRIQKKTKVEPVPKQAKSRHGWAYAIFISLIGFAIYKGNKSGGDQIEDKPVIANSLINNSPWDGSVHMVEQYLKSTYLKDPDSYESIEWGKVVTVEDEAYNFAVRHKYRAKNSFWGIYY